MPSDERTATIMDVGGRRVGLSLSGTLRVIGILAVSFRCLLCSLSGLVACTTGCFLASTPRTVAYSFVIACLRQGYCAPKGWARAKLGLSASTRGALTAQL